MRPSRLFGTLEAPGQKAYPSKDMDYHNLNPKQPTQITQVTIQKKLSNGLVWAHPNQAMPLTTMDKYLMLDPQKTWRHLSQGTGSFGADFKANNPETITSSGILPRYPDEEKMRAMLDSRPRVMAQAVDAKQTFPMAEKPEISLPKLSSKFTPDKLKRLADMGIPEELIGKAIEEELKKDMMTFLNNPALLAEVQTTEAIQQIYEKYVMNKRSMKTGENAGGDAPGAGAQNVGVRIGANAAVMSMLSSKQQRLAEMRASELGNVAASVLGRVSEEDMAGYNLYLAPMAAALGAMPRLLNEGAGVGGGGLSDSPFGRLAGMSTSAAEAAQAQEAQEEEVYEGGHSRREMAEGEAAAAGMSGFAAAAAAAVGGKGKGGRKEKPYFVQLETLEKQVGSGKAQQTINETIQSLRRKGAPEEEIQAARERGRMKLGGGGGF